MSYKTIKHRAILQRLRDITASILILEDGNGQSVSVQYPVSNKTIKRKAILQSLDGHNIVHLDCERRQWIERNCGSMAGNIGRLNDHQADGGFSCPSQLVCQPGTCHHGRQGF